jgi:hypothetical protein
VTSLRRILHGVALMGGGLFAALVSHAMMFALESHGVLGKAYTDHAHFGAGMAAVLVCASLCALAAFYLVNVIQHDGRQSITAMARTIAAASPPFAAAVIAAAALAGLASMEGLEGSIATAFGSMPIAGIGITALIAFVASFGIRRFARWIAETTERVAAILMHFVRQTIAGAVSFRRLRFVPVFSSYALEYVRIRGLRAPPFILA